MHAIDTFRSIIFELDIKLPITFQGKKKTISKSVTPWLVHLRDSYDYSVSCASLMITKYYEAYGWQRNLNRQVGFTVSNLFKLLIFMHFTTKKNIISSWWNETTFLSETFCPIKHLIFHLAHSKCIRQFFGIEINESHQFFGLRIRSLKTCPLCHWRQNFWFVFLLIVWQKLNSSLWCEV